MPPTFSHFYNIGGSPEGRWPGPHNWGWNNWGRNGHGHHHYNNQNGGRGFGFEKFPPIRLLPPMRDTTTMRPPKTATDLQIVGITVFSVAILVAIILFICKGCCVLCAKCRKSKSVVYIREVGDSEETSQETGDCGRRRSRQSEGSVVEPVNTVTPVEGVDLVPSAPPSSSLYPNIDSLSDSPGPPPFDPPPTYGEAVLQTQYGTQHILGGSGKI